MNSNIRVVVTGVGMITPCGLTAPETWDSLINGKSGITRITRFDPSEFTCQIAGEVKNFDPLKWISKKDIRRMDRFSMLGIAASEEAIKDAGLEINDENRQDIGVIVGSGIGGLATMEEQYRRFSEKGASRISPMLIPNMIINAVSGNISIRFGVKGPNISVVSACASGAHAIGAAFRSIQNGEAKIMITGGCEAPITFLGLGGFCALGALSTRNDTPETASRPFDKTRDGFVMGEGAGILVLEELENAKRRGAKIYAELAGFGQTGEAYHITQPAPDGEGAAEAMNIAIKDAKLDPEDVDYINAHGTSTPYNDATETQAIKKVFKEHAYKVMVSSTKSMTGHLLGAAGGVEGVISVLTIKENIIPPTINYNEPDPECDLDYVPNQAREKRVNVVLSNSLGFGGHNACIVFKRFDGSF